MTFIKRTIRPIVFSVLSILGGVTLGAGLVGAATTISSNIVTAGTLSVTGSTTVASQFNAVGGATLGALTAGATTIGAALTYGGVTLSNAVTGTGNMVLSASPTFTGTAIMSGVTLSGLASTTQLKVGSDQVSTVSGMIFGFCTIAGTSLTASTTTQVTCAGATGVTTSYRVFVQATSSLPTPLVIQSATSSSGAIEVNIYDSGIATTTTINISPTSLNFWAVR